MENDNDLFRDESLKTDADWKYVLETFGHVWFALDGIRWFVFPEGPHKYGLCRWRGPDAPNFPERKFDSEEAFLNAKLFDGRSILERLDEVMCYEA